MGGLHNDEVIPLVRRFMERVREQYRIELALLFGSRAREDYLLSSDVDVLLVSDDFKETPFRRRMADVLAFWNDEVDLEVFCYTADEFLRKKEELGIVRQADKEGLRI